MDPARSCCPDQVPATVAGTVPPGAEDSYD